MDFVKYPHLERFGNTEVNGIEDGSVYIFPKIDGTNASVWAGHDRELCCGSRNRQLTLDNDNAGFMKAMVEDEKINQLIKENPHHRFYGEWLVPHSLKTYKDDAWRQFYIFDALYEHDEECYFERYEDYSNLLADLGIKFIPLLVKYLRPTVNGIYEALDKNDYLIGPNQGTGEGIVIKNYDYVNRYGRVTWAKIVTQEFKAKAKDTMGQGDPKDLVETKIAKKFVTQSLVDKEFAKIEVAEDGWRSQHIPRLLNVVYHSIITEDMWDILKKNNNPTINFQLLQRTVTEQIKERKPELF
jgi:hypothetical protein